MFFIKCTSASLQICYMESLYHTLYHVGYFKLIHFIIFCCCFFFLGGGGFSVFTGKSVKVSDCIMFPMKFSSDSIHICYIDSLYQYVGIYKLIYFIIFFNFWCFITVFTLKNMALEKFGLGSF